MSKKKITKQSPLSGKQARFLRGLGHHLSPLVMVGREGITDKLVGSVLDVLAAHELVKIKLQQNCPIDRKEVAEELATATGSAVAQVLGKTILLFKENKEKAEDKRIKIPK